MLCVFQSALHYSKGKRGVQTTLTGVAGVMSVLYSGNRDQGMTGQAQTPLSGYSKVVGCSGKTSVFWGARQGCKILTSKGGRLNNDLTE
jgi:hypothetical protein